MDCTKEKIAFILKEAAEAHRVCQIAIPLWEFIADQLIYNGLGFVRPVEGFPEGGLCSCGERKDNALKITEQAQAALVAMGRKVHGGKDDD